MKVLLMFNCRQKGTLIKWDASFRWSFGPICAWGSIETMTIGTTHPTLVYETQKRITDRLKIRKADFGFI